MKRQNIIVVLIAVIIAVLGMWVVAQAADVTMKWEPNPEATGYMIYMSTDKGATWSTGTDIGNVTTYIWVSVSESGIVLFRIASYNADGVGYRSWYGCWYDATLKPALPPTGFGGQ